MADSGMPLHHIQHHIIEALYQKSSVALTQNCTTVVNSDTCTVLTAMLQGKQAIPGQFRSIHTATADVQRGKHTAFIMKHNDLLLYLYIFISD
jgi:hypothetical protein